MACSNISKLSYAYMNLPPLVCIVNDTLNAPRSLPCNPGVITNTLRRLIDVCCEAGAELGTGYPATNPRDLEITPGNVSFVFPIRKSLLRLQTYVQGAEVFLPVMESPGFTILSTAGQVAAYGADNSQGLLGLIVVMWPILCILLLACGMAGIVMWALDCRKNPVEFPRHFLNGFGEGLWWAFVTATTVGYGDRKPKFVVARVFGVVWMLIGAGLMALFTACLTTSLNLSAKDREIPFGSDVDVLNGTEEMIYAIAMGANIHVYNNLRSMVVNYTAFSSGKVSFMLLDHLQKFSVIKQLASSNIKITTDKQFPTIYGIVLRDLNSEVKDCMSRTVEKMRFQAFVDMDELRMDQSWASNIVAKDRFLQIIEVDVATLVYAGLALTAVFFVLWITDILVQRSGKKQLNRVMNDDDHRNLPATLQPT